METIMNTPPWRAVEHAQHLIASLRHRRQRQRPAAQTLVCRALVEHGVDAATLLRALDAARDGGAYELASQLAERLDLERLDTHQRQCAVASLTELCIAVGDRDAAERATAHRPLLEATARGATVLDVLRQRPLTPFLPDGRLNGYALGRAIAERKVDGERLLSLVASRPDLWLTHRELQLMAFSAFAEQDAPRAARFLSRYLRSQGLPSCRLSGDGNMLARMAFEPPPPSSGPLVSILVSAYNAEHTIGYAIESLLAQSHGNIEILVADDASSDGTHALVRERFGREPRVRLFRSAKNQGPYNLRNALIERARGHYIAIHDADDHALPQRIARQLAALQGSEAVACATSWLRMDSSGHVLFFRDHIASRLALSSLMMKRHAIDAVGHFRSARFGADLEHYEDMRAHFGASRVLRLREPLLFGLWSSASLTRAARAESLETGYRAPARRLYSELVFRKRCTGRLRASSAEIAESLLASDNHAAPLPIAESS